MKSEPYQGASFSEEQSISQAQWYREQMKLRRSLRHFSSRRLPEGVLEACIEAASRAPSGANQQPWHFAVIKSPAMKAAIREAAEKEEWEFYHGRAPQEWLDALAPLGTDEHKPFLTEAPALVAVFAKVSGANASKHYYVQESVGIACGFLIAGLHLSGLSCLTHTPSPMKFLGQLLERPREERPFLLLVVGYPAEGAEVPQLTKKSADEFMSVH